MKKTVIIAIILAYVASILIVQFFGLKVIPVEGNTYITDIEVNGFEFTNRGGITDPQLLKVTKMKDSTGKNKDEIHYGGYFIAGTYDKSEESLAENPNRIKLLYVIRPYNATHTEVTFDYDTVANEGVIYVDEKTQEIVFLKARTVTFILNTHDGSMVRKEIKISLG